MKMKNTRKKTLESVIIKNSIIGLRHVLDWTKRDQDPKSGTFGGFGKRGQTDIHTRFMFYKYRYQVA